MEWILCNFYFCAFWNFSTNYFNSVQTPRVSLTLYKTIYPEARRREWFTAAIPNPFGTRDKFHGRQFFQGLGWSRWCFQDDSSASHSLCTLFLLLLHEFHFRSLVIRSWRVGTPDLQSLLWGSEKQFIGFPLWLPSSGFSYGWIEDFLPLLSALCFCPLKPQTSSGDHLWSNLQHWAKKGWPWDF